MATTPKKGLSSALSDGPSSPYANRCSIGSFIRSLDDADAQAMQDALHKVAEALRTKTSQSSGYTTSWIRKVVAEFGVNLSERMLRRHCAGECSCDS